MIWRQPTPHSTGTVSPSSSLHSVMVPHRSLDGLSHLDISTTTSSSFRKVITGHTGESFLVADRVGQVSRGLKLIGTRYHSHVGFQLSTSQGPIIVDQKEWKTPVEYDEDLVVMIGEYWHVSALTIYHTRSMFVLGLSRSTRPTTRRW